MSDIVKGKKKKREEEKPQDKWKFLNGQKSSSTTTTSQEDELEQWKQAYGVKDGQTSSSSNPQATTSYFTYMEQDRQRRQEQAKRDKLMSGEYSGNNPVMRTVYSGFSQIGKAADRLGIKDAADVQARSRDLDWYTKMYEDAKRTGSKPLAEKARQGYEEAYKAGTQSEQQMQQKAAAYHEEQRAKYDAWQQQYNPGEYYGTRMSQGDIQRRLSDINRTIQYQQRSKDAAEAGVRQSMYDSGYTGGGYDAEMENYTRENNRLSALKEEQARYEAALRYSKDAQTEETGRKYSIDTMGRDEFYRKARAGKARYEADEKAAADRRTDAVLDIADGREDFVINSDEYRKIVNAAGGFSLARDDTTDWGYYDITKFYAMYDDDPESAKAWLRHMKTMRDEQEVQAYADQYGQEWTGRVGAFFMSPAISLASGLDPYGSWGQKASRIAEGMQQGVTEGLTEHGLFDTGALAGEVEIPLLGKVNLGTFAGIGMSMVQSGMVALPAMAIGDEYTAIQKTVEFLGTALMGSSAAASDYREKLKAGWSETDAMMHSLWAGLAEAGFEYISLDKLVDQDVTAGIVKNFFTQGGVEASEEFCTTVANRISDAAIARKNGYDTSIEDRAKELVAQGYSYDGAMQEAKHEWYTELINDAFAGFVSGGGMTMMHHAAASVEQAAARKGQRAEYARSMQGTEGAVEAIRKYAADRGLKEVKDSKGSTRQDARQGKSMQAAEEDIAKRMQEAAEKSGVQGANQFYTELVEKYGDGIRSFADAALDSAVSSAVTATTEGRRANAYSVLAHQETVEGIQDERAREVSKGAMERAVYSTMMDETDESAFRRGANYIRQNRGQMSMEVEVQSEDGTTKKAGVVSLTKDRNGVVLSDGSTVSLDKIQTDAESKDVLDVMAASKMTEQASAEMLDALTSVRKDGSIDTRDWASDYIEAYDRGTVGVKSIDEAVTMAKNLPAEIASQAYQAGQRDAGEIPTAQRMKMDELRKKVQPGATGRRGVFYADGVSEKTLNRLKNDKATGAEFRAQVEAMKLIAKATGVDIYLREMSQADAEGRLSGSQGSYKNGVIVIDVNAGLNNINRDLNRGLLAVTGHELTHWMKETAPEAFAEYRDAVRDALIRKVGSDAVDKLIDDQMAADTRLSREEALEEVVADAGMRFISDEAFWGAVTESLGEDKHSIKQKIQKFFRDFFAKLREILGKTSQVGEAARIVDELEEAVQKSLGKLYAEGIRQGSQTWQQMGDVAMEGGDAIDRASIRTGMETAGIEVDRDNSGRLIFRINGRSVTHVTAEHIAEHSAWGALIKTARDGFKRFGIDGNITASQARKQFSAVADLMNLIMETQNPEMVWELAGSQMFSAIKSNSDGQYGTTVDFSTVCRKTVEMVKAMSERMMELGRGLTKDEVTQLQKDLIDAGAQVPCPVCYVFSRWAGAGTLLDTMCRFQEKYADAKWGDPATIAARISELENRDKKGERAAIRARLQQDDVYTGLVATKENLQAQNRYNRKELKKAIKAGNEEAKARLERSIEFNDMAIKKAQKEIEQMEKDENVGSQELAWLKRVRSKAGYEAVPLDILFNMYDRNAVETFMTRYKNAWSYRTTRGPSAGKAILPYADMRLGDMFMPLGKKSSDGNKTFANPMKIDGKFSDKQNEAIINAIARTRAQNLIGGQRFQSTSDFRYDYALDYIQVFFEAQVLGSNMQTYTKIVEFGEMVARIGGDVNLSAMPLNKGYVEENGKKHLVYSNVTGIDINAAIRLKDMYDSAQIILVGINDEHIRLALEDSEETGGIHIGFVIPYHASGASIDEFIRVLVGNLNEEFVRKNYQDYSDVQTDKEKAKATTDQLRRRELRSMLLTGKQSVITETVDEEGNTKKTKSARDWRPSPEDVSFMRSFAAEEIDISDRSFEDLLDVETRALQGDPDAIREYERWSAGVLWDLANKMWNGGEEDGVRLTSTQAEHIMPHEYWNKTVDRAHAYVNGFIFRSYCYNLGLHPRFTGINSKGKTVDHGDFRSSTGYWKTLIDRSMYANDGTYRDQQKINMSEMQAGWVTREYGESRWGEFKVNEPDLVRAARVGRSVQGKKNTAQEGGRRSSRITAEQDTEYLELAKHPKKNAARLQEMVDEAAKKAGYTIKAYHGTANAGRFNVFDAKKLNNSKLSSHIGQGFYFTNSKSGAQEYMSQSDIYGNLKKGKNPYLFEGYIKLQNPIEVGPSTHTLSYEQIRDIVADGDKQWFFSNGIPFELQNKVIQGARYSKNELSAMSNDQKIDLYARYLLDLGDMEALSHMVDAYSYDTQGLLLDAMKKHTGKDGIHWEMREGLDQFVVFDSSQFKESSPVTYDDAGKPIPLSQRFDTDNEDIRYSNRPARESSFSTLKEIDAEISRLTDQMTEIYGSKGHAEELAKKDPRVIELRDKMWAAEDEKGRTGSIRERMAYRHMLNQVMDEIGYSDGDPVEIRKKIDELKQQREMMVSTTPITDAQYEKLVRHFGTTEDSSVAGFILQDGRMLDFSGKKQLGAGYSGGREIYHNEVGDVLDLDTDTSPRINMVNNGNIRLAPEVNGINLSMQPTAQQRDALRGYIDANNGNVKVDIDNAAGRTVETFTYYPGTSASKVLNDIDTYFETGEAPAPQSSLREFYSRRDTSMPSDLDIIESLDETKADTPEGKALVKDAKRSASRLAELRKQLDELIRQNPQLQDSLESVKSQFSTTDRKLKTKGISGVSLGIMKELGAGDAKDNGVAKRITEVLTQVYQDALDQIDAGVDAGTVMDGIYNEGVMRIVDILARDATHSEKFGRHWETVPLGVFYGEEGRQALIDTVNAAVTYDFVTSRYRDAIQATAADVITERVEGRMQKKIDEVKAQNTKLSGQNRQMSEEITDLRKRNDDAQGHIEFLDEQLQEARKALKDTTKMTEAERKKAKRKADRLAAQLAAARKTAQAMKGMLERRMLVSEHEAAMNRVARERAKEQAAARKKQAALEADVAGYEHAQDLAGEALARSKQNAEGWERVADLTSRQVDRLMREKQRAIRKLEDQIAREEKILQGVLKPPAIQKMLSDARRTAAAEARKAKDEVFERAKDRKRASELRSRIKNLSDEMKRRMTRPTDGAYVPASLYGSMTHLADVLDEVLAPNPGTKAAERYKAMMDGIRRMSSEYAAVADLDDPVYSSEYDEQIKADIDAIERTLTRNEQTWLDQLTGDTQKRLPELSTAELQHIYELMKSINYNMKNAATSLSWNEGKSLYEAMRDVAAQQQELTPLEETGKFETSKRGRLLRKMSTMRAVEMMSGYQRDAALYQLMHGIEQGVVDADSWVMNYDKAMQPLKNGKNELEYRRAISKKLDFGATTDRGTKVLMTKMQAIQILMTAEREAHNDKLVHLQKGGAVIRDKSSGKSYTIQVTPELLARIQDRMTEWDKAYMKTIREYFGREGKATNEILYKLKHRVLQTEEYYVPYQVDKNYLETKLDTPEAAMSMWVKTPGSTNALAQKASQPVYIDGMDAVMGHHVREIANYIGLALAIRDFSKVYNGMLSQGDGENPLPVKETIYRNFGADGQKLLTQAVIDIQGGRRGNQHRTGIGKFLEAMQSSFYKTALLINPSVTIKQAASYVAIESILDHRAVIAGNRPIFVQADKSWSPSLIAHLFAAPSGATAMRLYNEIDAHTSMHYMRRQGMSMRELASQANRSGPIARAKGMVGASMEQAGWIGHKARQAAEAISPLNWIQRMDVATTAAIWVACKEQAKMDGMEVGTDEYWQHVTELYERCLRETQPMYDDLHRNEYQKDREGLMSYLFPFRTVPIQNHGQLANSFENMRAARKSGDKARMKAANRFFRKTVAAQTMSAAVFSVMTFLAAALKRKTKKYRDDDEEISAETIGIGIGKDVVGTLISVFAPLFGSTIWDTGNNVYDAVRTGKSIRSYDSFSVGVVDLLNELESKTKDIATDVAGMIAGSDVDQSKFRDHVMAMVEAGAKCAGIPYTTIKTYSAGIRDNITDILEGRIPALNDEAADRTNAVNAGRYWKAWVSGDDAKMRTVLDEMIQNYLDDGKDEDKAHELTRNALGSAVMDRYTEGELDLQELSDYMEGTGLWDDEKRQDKLAGIIRDECQAGLRTEDETIDLLTEICGWDEDKAWKKANEWQAKGEHADDEDYSYSQYDEIDGAIDANKDIKALVKELTDHGVKAESVASHVKQKLIANYVAGGVTETALKNQLARYCGITAKDDVEKILKDANSKKSYGVAYSSLDEEYRAGHISRTDLVRALKQYGGLSDEDANKKVRWYDLQKKYPDMDITEAWSNHYYDGTSKTQENGHQSASAAGMTVKQYVDAMKVLSKISGTDANGDGKTDTNSKEIAYIAAIDAMNLTGAQKWALYYEVYKGANWKKVARPNW